MARSSLPARLAAVTLLAACSPPDPMKDPDIAAHCDRPPFRTVEERAEAMQRGHRIYGRLDCIEKGTYDRAEASYASPDAEDAQRAGELPAGEPAPGGIGLREARAAFRTKVGLPATGVPPLPSPPAALFVRSDYDSAVGKLPAWVTPDPRDGEKHPAIVWITGGESNSLDDFWTEGGAANDQSASAFRKAGVIMMFPTLRGGNSNAGSKEFFFGEVDDVVAAGEHLASLPYVGSVYLGGHSTGGTLALLVAEYSDRFAAVFAFGPVGDVTSYPPGILPVDFGTLPAQEARLRSPIHWLDAITTPTYLIEGEDAPGNLGALEQLCARSRNPQLRCIPVPGQDHFSVLDAAAKKIAARLAVSMHGVEFKLGPEHFRRAE